MGVHFPMMLPLDLFTGGTPAPEDYDADEAPIAARLQNFFATESACRSPVVEAPVGISVLPEEICSAPRRWTQRYYNLKQKRHHPNGGHFGAWEEPQAIVTDVRDFFRGLR